jgi:hypothetical protein
MSTPAEPSTPSEGTRQAECPYVAGTVTRYCTLTPLTLTDAEREAIAACCDRWHPPERIATLRGLLERTSVRT